MISTGPGSARMKQRLSEEASYNASSLRVRT